MSDHLAEPDHTSAEVHRRPERPAPRADGASPLIGEARRLLGRVAMAMATATPRETPSFTVGDDTRSAAQSRRATLEVEALRGELREVVVSFAYAERVRGTPPERVVALIRSAIDDVNHEALSKPAGRALRNDVVRWSIEAYYGG